MSALAPLALAEVEASAACIAELQQVMAEGLIRIGHRDNSSISASAGLRRGVAAHGVGMDARGIRFSNR